MTDAKTPSGLRTISAHPSLASIITKRSKGKAPDAYLLRDLRSSGKARSATVQPPSAKPSRASVAAWAWMNGHLRRRRQSNVDFHSWRRWFVRKVVEGLERGASLDAQRH